MKLINNLSAKTKIISIVLGVLEASAIIFNNIFVTNCFPSKYQNDNLILLICGFLIMGGILIFNKNNSYKFLYKMFLCGLIFDIFAKTIIYGSSFLSNDLILKIPIIAFELIFIFLAFRVIKDKNLEFEENAVSNQSITDNNKIIDSGIWNEKSRK